MDDAIKPRNGDEVQQAVAWAVDHDKRLELAGGGSKRVVGRPIQTDNLLDLSGLSGITLYEPEELVLAAQAGTPLRTIEEALAEKGQQLAFEPADLSGVLGTKGAGTTIGGVLAANLSGPRRIKAGAARDHFLGVSAVSGRAEVFKSGGRVVKNVTGYDLCKVLAGSWGTLAAMTDVTVKVLPAAETQATIVIAGLDDAAASAAMSAALGSSCDVSAAAHLPRDIAALPALSALTRTSDPATLLRLEGFAPSVAYRADQLKAVLASYGEMTSLAADASAALWRQIGAVAAFADDLERPLWRISVAPSDGYKVVRRIRAASSCRAFYDWGGGLVWLEMEESGDAGTDVVRQALGGAGHATLMRGHPALRASVGAFQPQPEPLAALSRRLKESFDPKAIFNPGRMDAGG